LNILIFLFIAVNSSNEFPQNLKTSNLAEKLSIFYSFLAAPTGKTRWRRKFFLRRMTLERVPAAGAAVNRRQTGGMAKTVHLIHDLRHDSKPAFKFIPPLIENLPFYIVFFSVLHSLSH